MEDTIPSSYTVIDTCYNCKYCYIKRPYYEEMELYCTYYKPVPSEYFSEYRDTRVSQRGKCEHWEPKE